MSFQIFQIRFNPHARVGRDTGKAEQQKSAKVSIHTPAWGVTCIQKGFYHLYNCFNPHARVGRDNTPAPLDIVSNVSIHTPAWGVTLHKLSICTGQRVSIHTPAWGVTRLYRRHSGA